jgi:cysteinyl-tRNA synthetase
VKEGNIALERDDIPAVTAALGEVRGMLGVFGLDPADPVWADDGSSGSALEPVVDGLVKSLLLQRQDARARKDFAAADAIRDTLTGLGVKVEDTPAGARWSLV